MPKELLVIFEDEGRVGVRGMIRDKVAAYGLLEAARDAVQEYHQKNQQKVQPAGAEDLAKIVTPGN